MSDHVETAAVETLRGRQRNPLLEVLWVSTRLGLTSFGGPIAHLGYFHEEYVKRKKWIDEQSYADLAALCQFLPGPASSQVGIAIGNLLEHAFWEGLARMDRVPHFHSALGPPLLSHSGNWSVWHPEGNSAWRYNALQIAALGG